MIHPLKSAAIAAALCATAVLTNAGTTNLMPVSTPGNSISTATNNSATMTVNDEELSRLVKSSINKSMGSDGREITVSVDHGVATVGSQANTSANADQARILAYRVLGVWAAEENTYQK
jgi:osmotically-inducible protein OsmY